MGPRIPIWITRDASSTPSSTARRNTVPCVYASPQYSSHVSG